MKSRSQHEQEAIKLSIVSKHRIVWNSRSLIGGIKQYRIYRIHRGTKAELIKVTTDPATLCRVMRREVTGGVKKSSRPRTNPIESGDEAAARELVENFTGREVEPDEYEQVPTPARVRALAQIGKIAAIEYVAFRDDKEYRFRHEFKSRARPALAVAPDGKTVTMIGGSWKFGEDGFEDQ